MLEFHPIFLFCAVLLFFILIFSNWLFCKVKWKEFRKLIRQIFTLDSENDYLRYFNIIAILCVMALIINAFFNFTEEIKSELITKQDLKNAKMMFKEQNTK